MLNLNGLYKNVRIMSIFVGSGIYYMWDWAMLTEMPWFTSYQHYIDGLCLTLAQHPRTHTPQRGVGIRELVIGLGTPGTPLGLALQHRTSNPGGTQGTLDSEEQVLHPHLGRTPSGIPLTHPVATLLGSDSTRIWIRRWTPIQGAWRRRSRWE